jgi:hypothetical protein
MLARPRPLDTTRVSRHALPHGARLRARHDVSPIAALGALLSLGLLIAADAAWAASDVRVTVEESASLDVVVTVSAKRAPTFQVFTMPGAPHQFVIELPGQALEGVPVESSGAGLLLLDAHAEAQKKNAPARVVLAFADDVDYDASTSGGSLVVKFAHTGDMQVLLAAAEKRRAERDRLRTAKLEEERLAAERERARAEAEAAKLAQIEQKKREAEAARVAALEALQRAEQEKQLALAKKKLEEEQKRVAVLEAKRKAEEEKKRLEDEKKAALEKKRLDAENKKLALLAEKKKLEEAKRAAEEQKKKDEEAKRLAALDAKRRAAEEARLKVEEEKRVKAEAAAKVAAELLAKKKADEEQKKLAALELQKQAEEAARRRAEDEARLRAQDEARRVAALEAQRQADEARRAAALAEQRRAEDAARIAREQEERRLVEAENERRAEMQRRIAQERQLEEQKIAMARRAADERRREEERLRADPKQFAEVSTGERVARAPGPVEPGFGGTGGSIQGRAAPAEVRTRDRYVGPGSIDLAPPARYERFIPPPDEDSGWADQDSEIDETFGKSVLTQVLVQRVGDASRVGVRVDGGARYNVERHGTELTLVLFDARPASFDLRRALDARGLGANVVRVVPSVEEDDRYRVALNIELRRKAPIRLSQEDGVLWLSVADR